MTAPPGMWLSGATEGWQIPSEQDLRAAVFHLMSCPTHHGAHHFAILGSMKTLYCSKTAIECINGADLGFRLPI